jgi:aminoglycoside phosphotransferase (APT) family kinase protein
MVSQVAAFISRRWRVAPGLFHVEVQPLHGGLESTVARARISRLESHSSIPSQFVVKQLPAGLEREADVYELLWRHLDRPPAVRMIGREVSAQETYLYLEHAQSSVAWPWSDPQRAGAVCRTLARLHDSQTLPRDTFAWDYESGLARSAHSTVELASDVRDAAGRRCWRRLGDLRRLVAALPRIRHRLLSRTTTVIHGDVHPGNVILRGSATPDVALIDWARARLGSPLEDIASWLHSLGCWEPEARRRHDTLMRIYLDARRTPQPFASAVRVDYWLASASNGLSGAIRYHLATLSNPAATEAARYDSGRALTAWTRVVRRAAALVNTNLDRCA